MVIQYRDVRARELATKHLFTGLTEMITRIFMGMMEKGLLRKGDPEKTEEAIRQVEAFSRHFIRVYGQED